MALIQLILGVLDKLLSVVAPFLKPTPPSQKSEDDAKKLRDGFDEAEKTGRPPA